MDLRWPASLQELERVQRERKEVALERARQSPFLRKRIPQGRAEDIWHKIPLLTKEELRQIPPERFHDEFCIQPRTKVVEYWRSGGATGRPLFYPRSAEDMEHGLRAFARAWALIGAVPDDCAHISFPLGVHPVAHLYARTAINHGIGTVWCGAGTNTPSETQLELIDHLKPTIWLGTRFGVVWGLGCLAWLLVLALSARRATAPALRPATVGATGAAVPRPGAALVAVTALAVALAFLPGLGGHAGVQDPVALLLPANVLHVLSAGAWIGGIAALVLALPAATRRLGTEARTPLLAATVGRFSTLALAAVAGLLLGGIVQSILQLEDWDDLLDTAFGRAVLIKIGLVVVLLAFGAVNRRRTVPRLRRAAAEHAPTGRDGALLRRALRAELALGVTALAVTGALAGYPPATAQSAGPYSGSADLGPARAELTVDPARPGPNEAHLYLFDRASGRQWDVPKEVHVDAELPGRDIAPIELARPQGGPRPLRHRGRRAGARRRLAARGRRARDGVRRVPHDLRGPDPVKEPAMRIAIAAATCAAALLAPAAAGAHVTVQPDTAPAGGFTRLDVRVPNERDDAGTVKVDVQLPPGIAFASYEPVPGWDVKITRAKAAEPIDVEGLSTDQEIRRITWTGDGEQGVVGPGQFQDFGLSLRMPDGQAGDALAFKALQTYDDGDVVRWIGPADAEEPAATVTLTEAAEGGGHGAPGAAAGDAEEAPAASSAPAAATGSDDDGGGSDGLAIAALIVGALGLVAGVAGLLAARSARSSDRERLAA